MGPRFERRLHWLIALRLVAITGAALPYSLLQLARAGGEWHLQSFDLFAGAIYLASLVYIFAVQVFSRHLRVALYVQLTGDLLAITTLVYFFGGPASPFSMLYLVAIAVAASLLSRREALSVGAIAWLLYAGMGLGLYYRWIAAFGDAGESVAASLLAYNLSMHFFGFLAVALLTSFLAENARRAERDLLRAARSLRALEGLHRDVVQSMPSGLVTADEAGLITSVNRGAAEILGPRVNGLLGRPLAETGLFTDLPAQWGLEPTDPAGPAPPPLRGEITMDVPGRGAAREIGFTVSRLTDDGGKRRGTMVLFQDLSPLRRLQEELRMKDRMAAAGELAAGLAHEIGNPLAAISGSVQMLRGYTNEANPDARGPDEPASRDQLLDIVLRESQRLDRTIKSFLRFARPRERSSKRFDIARLVREHATLLRNSDELLPGHQLEVDIAPASVTLIADPDQISQILWNLVRNALRAMPVGGTLRLSARLVAAVYRITVADEGRGMTEDERSHLFAPFRGFFGAGAGVGMAIVYRIVEEHGGRVSVDSAPGAGTRITIDLPMTDVATTGPGGAESPAEAATTATAGGWAP